MKTGTPFILDDFEENTDIDTTFEFTQTRIWNDGFFSPEISTANEISLLREDIAQLKELITDIKTLISDNFG